MAGSCAAAGRKPAAVLYNQAEFALGWEMRGAVVRLVIFLSLLALALLPGGCGQDPTADLPPVAFGPAPWQDGDRVEYVILDRSGGELGSSTFSYHKTVEGWSLRSVDQAGALRQSGEVVVTEAEMRPLHGTKEISTTGTEARVEFRYAEGKVRISALVNGENRSAEASVPELVVENDQILMSLRAAPLAAGYKARATLFNSASASAVSMGIEVTGEEAVSVGGQSVNCYKVGLRFGEVQQTAWYSADAVRRLIKYDNGSSQLLLRSLPGG